ncbi:hypothetical protein ACROYT_G017057 [Oculina patagonica]
MKLLWKTFVKEILFSLSSSDDACIEAARNRTAKHDEEEDDDDVFTKSLQAKWFNSLSHTLCNDISGSLKNNNGGYDPKVLVQNMIDVLKEESAAEGKEVDDIFYQGLEDLKNDPDFSTIMTEFEEALNGNRNMMTVGTDLPELQEEESDLIKDVGLKGQVITGEESETENDLIRYSNYMSGAGSTFGGFMAELPEDIKDLTKGTMKSMTYKYDALQYKLKKRITVDELRNENFETRVKANIEPEVEFRFERTGVIDLQEMVVSESFDKIKVLQGVGDEQRLAQQNFNTQKKLAQQNGRISSKKVAGKILRKVGNGVETSTTAFTIAQGGVDAAAGSDMIQKARELRAEGVISEGDYNEMIRNGRLRIAQGSFGLANGMQNVVKFVGKRVEKHILKKAGQAGIKLLKQTKRFGSFIGSAVSVGTSVVSMTKNAIAADDARKKGHVGKFIIYTVMAIIDGITAVLDGVSLVLDFVFPPLSPIIDLISTFLQVINTILGFFADLVDFRTTAQRVHDEFDTYINSEAFNTYVNNLANGYKNRGFDIFKYYVDADVAGIEADKETLQAERETITRCLTDKAKEDFNNKQLRVALVDSTSFGKTLRGRANDDEIVAGFGPDRIYGEEGDDILFGRGGSDTIYGGPGNDYLNGGTGRDTLLGGEGDDVLVCEPGVDRRCEGERGDDTLALSGESLRFKESLWNSNYITMGPEWEAMTRSNPRMSPVKGIYLDIGYTSGSGSNAKKGRTGINLGSCFPGWPDGFNKDIHKPAFQSSSSLEQTFLNLFNHKNPVSLSNDEELKSKMLWFLADNNDAKYFCDGISFYAVSESSVRVARGAIDSISTSSAVYSNGRLTYSRNKELEALLVFAFRRSFIFDEFEKISAAPPDDLEILSHYIPTTVIGSDEHNVIDVSYGLGDVVYTGEGNNVISIGSTINRYHFTESTVREGTWHGGLYNWAKYIVGGGGENTLVIQYMNLPIELGTEDDYYGRWQLRNIDKPFNPGTFSQYNTHVVYLKNIQNVEIHPPEPRQIHFQDINIDATCYDGARRYILNHTDFFKGPLSTEKDVTVLPRRLVNRFRDYSIIFGRNTKNTISFKYYEDESNEIDTINIYQEYRDDEGYITFRPKRRVWLENAMNVVSFSSCKNIIGNDKENLLIAVGGETTIDARDGDDTLVSARGRHELIGGPGSDTYVLHGPDVEDYLTISVVMGDDGNTIRCKTTIYGKWMEAEKRLFIDVLKHDHNDVLLNTVEIIPAQDDEGKNLGTISKDTANRKIIFEPGSNFNFLKRNKAKVVRIRYTTTGSMATIKEEDYGSQLRFESIKGLDQFAASIEDDKLVFKDKSNPPRTVLIDDEWGNKLKTGIATNLFDLIIDFAQRFPIMLFRKNDQEFSRVTAKDIITFLYEHLKHLETALGQEYDTIIDSTSLPSDVGDEIDVGNGQNIVLAKTRGKTYKLGSKSSGSIIVANKFTQGTGKVTITGGDDSKSLNAVVVGVGSGGVVEIFRMGPHDVIITGALPSEVRFYKDDNEKICLKDSQQRDLIKGSFNENCKKLIFKKSQDNRIIFDCSKYITVKISPSHIDYPIIVSHGADQLLKLNLPFKKSDAIIDLHYDGKFLWVYFKVEIPEYNLVTMQQPYLVIPAGYVRPMELDAKMLVNSIRFQFKAGIQFSDRSGGLVIDSAICPFVIEKLTSSPPQGYELKNLDLQC